LVVFEWENFRIALLRLNAVLTYWCVLKNKEKVPKRAVFIVTFKNCISSDLKI
jgi:hypothetical protein